MTAYYNENDPFAATWLRELIKSNLIAPGEVDERSIEDVKATDLKGFAQCHFFAGIGGWSYALRLAGWPDDRPVWTGSCPCPSFSAAGKGEGFEDPRHLWPRWFGLICESRPPTIFGEQADKAIGFGWLDLVQTDLEAQGYAVGATVLGAHSVGAPHRRQRLYFVADSANGDGWRGERREETGTRPDGERRRGSASGGATLSGSNAEHGDDGTIDSFNSEQQGLEGHFGNVREWRGSGWLDPPTARSVAEAGATRGFWADCDWWYGRDEKYRPIGPGIFPLVAGAPARVGRLRGYGNAITAQVAQAFIEAYMSLPLPAPPTEALEE